MSKKKDKEPPKLSPLGVPFDSLGVPTMAIAMAVQNEMPDAAIRDVAIRMKNLGWKISPATFGRWKKVDFVEPPPGKNPKKPADIAKKVNRKVNAAIAQIAETAALNGNPEIAEAVAFTSSKIDDLVKLPYGEIKNRLDILTMAVSIVALEQFAGKLPAMILMPKDSGAFIGSIAEASANMKPVGDVKPGDGKGDPKVIEGQAAPAEKPQTALSAKIAQFRKEQGLAVVR